jgi:hypothetical protein
MARFDVRQVSPLEWAGVGAAVVALVMLGAPWFALRCGCFLGDVDWTLEWLALTSVVLLVVGAVVVLLPHLGVRVPGRSGIWIGVSVLAVVCITFSRSGWGYAAAIFCGMTEGTVWFHAVVGATWVAALAALLHARTSRS